jgi:hypothetical protein
VIDGITIGDYWRILVKDQNDPKENGIYIVGVTSGNMVRSDDMITPA